MQADGHMSITEFTREFGRVAAAAYAADHNNAELRVVEAYPNYVVNWEQYKNEINPVGGFPVTITWEVVRREPGAVSGHPFQPRKMIKPTMREIKAYSTDDGDYIEIHGQWFDNLVQLDSWAENNIAATNLYNWLEEFLQVYSGYFMSRGVQNMYFYRAGRFTWGTNEEEAMTRWRNPLKVRSLTYYVRTETLWYKSHRDIKKIILSLEVEDS